MRLALIARSTAALALTLGLALPASAQAVVENEVAKVFNGQWMQSKEAGKNGLLMYLTQARAAQGEYFSIRCEPDGSRSIRVSFGEKLPDANGKVPRGDKPYETRTLFQIDEQIGEYPMEYTGPTEDDQIFQGTFHSYRMLFAGAEAEEQFLQALRRGSKLSILGQAIPVDLTGAVVAIQEQAGYCG